MASVAKYRPMVIARAGGACEYCRLLQDASGVTFHVDHVIPESCGGQTAFNNLDRETGRIVPRTPIGEATIQVLRINDVRRMFARQFQIVAGLIG